jgi:hypothetical protein
VAANVIAEAGIHSRDDGGPKRRPAPSSMTARARDQPLRTMQGLDVLCPLDSLTIEHGSKHNGQMAMNGSNKIGGLARGCGPVGRAGELSQKKVRRPRLNLRVRY